MPDINTVVVTPTVSVVAVNSSVPGSYDSVARLGLGWYSVTDPIFGAVGDGVTNDTTAIQAALDAVPDGGVVFFPPGTYSADSLTLDGASHVTLDAGEATIKARTNATGTRILTLVDCVNVVVRGGHWDGNSLARCGISVRGESEDITIRDVVVRNITQYTAETDFSAGIEVKPDGALVAPSGTRILDCIVDGVASPVTDVARAIYVGNSGGPEGVMPRNVQIRGGIMRNVSGADGDAIQFAGNPTGTTVSDSIIDGVMFRECSKRAIKIDTQRVTIVNCDIRNDVASFTSAPISLYASHQVCANNRIYGPRSLHGIEIGAVLDLVDITCDGNTIELDSGTAVSNQDGIAVMVTLTQFSISRNHITKCRSGISFVAATGSPTTGVVAGNILQDFTVTGIRSDTTSPLLTTGVVYASNVFDTATGFIGIQLKDGSLNLAVGNLVKALGGGATLITGMTTDAVCSRWGNTGGSGDPSANTITDPLRFTKGLQVGTSGNGGDLTLSSAFHTIRQSASSGDKTLTLPAAASHTGRRYNVFKTDSTANKVILDGNGSETIAGLTTYSLTSQYQWVTIESDGTNWNVVAASRRVEGWSAVTGTTTVSDDYDGYFLGGTSWTLTLQSAATRRRPLRLRCTASGTITIARAGSDTIEGASTSLSVVAGETITLMPNGTNWLIVG